MRPSFLSAPPPMIATASTFATRPSIRIPALAAPPVRPRATPDLRAPLHLREAPLLLVDDDPAILHTLKLLLKRAGYVGGRAALGGAAALEGVGDSPPDLILLDLWMPGLSGFDVMRRLRDTEATRDVPILVLSGDERPEVKRDALDAGATDFLSKPFDVVEALLRIRNLLEMRFLHRASLRESANRYLELVESASDVIYETDVQGFITYANPAASALLGRSADELVGVELVELLPEADRERARRACARQLGEGVAESVFTLPVRSADGGERWLEHHLRLAVAGGTVTGFRAIARDVTDRQKLEGVKDQLIAHVSHELRTPLTAIHASLALLKSGTLRAYPERAARLVELADRNTNRLIRLVNETLEVERLGSGTLSIQRVPYPLAALLAEAAEVVQGCAERAGLFLVVDAPGDEWVLDPDRIHRVLVNLLGNAIKFSEAGGTVWLTARLREGELELAVRDQGRGIPHDRLESIFERFEQVEAQDAREKGGTGLGLAICRGIAQLHGGRIWAESEPGAGSTFRCRLPG